VALQRGLLVSECELHQRPEAVFTFLREFHNLELVYQH
jgi:hypothetical protein